MPVRRVPEIPEFCPCKIVLDGITYGCVRRRRGHQSSHKVEGPIEYRSSVTGLWVTIEHGLEWIESAL